ncbi:hypothetical protein ABKV19_025138 [Rosa sericea]
MESKPVASAPETSDADAVFVAPQPFPLSPRLPGKLSGLRSPTDSSDHGGDQHKIAQDEVSSVLNPPTMFKYPTHLITPSEILMAASSSENTNPIDSNTEGDAKIQDVLVKSDVGNPEMEVKVASDLGIEMAQDCCAITSESYITDEARQGDGASMSEPLAQPHSGEEDQDLSTKDVSGSATATTTLQLQTPNAKSRKQKWKNMQASGPSSPSPGVLNSIEPSNEAGGSSSPPSGEAAFPQIMKELMTMPKELQKQMTMMVTVPITNEGKRLEAALGRSMEKAVKANNIALRALSQEENAKNEKLLRDRTQQVTGLIVNKDFPVMLEKMVKNEIAAVGPAIVRAISPATEKTIPLVISDCFQRGVGDKAVNQLEKSVNSKLEATVSRQIEAQFQTSGKQALQDALKSSMEASVVPAFEKSCKAMFEQVDATFQKVMVEHSTVAQQHFESAHSPLAHALREAISSASSVTQTLSGELADGQRNWMVTSKHTLIYLDSGETPLLVRASKGCDLKGWLIKSLR